MIRRVLGAAALVACVAAPVLAQSSLPPEEQYVLRAEYRWWRPKLKDTTFQKGENGSVLDPIADLGVTDQNTFEVRAVVKLGEGHKIRGSFTRFDYDGDVVNGRTFVYGETTFLESSRVITSLKGNYITGEYEWDFVRRPRGFLGVFVGGKFFDVDALIVSPDQGAREVDTLRAPIPVVGLASRTYTNRLSVSVEVSGMKAGSLGWIYELDVAAQLHLSDRLAAVGGYRRMHARAEDLPDFIQFKTSGLLFGVELSL
jgi:hypothetical protein